jgi:hypothetical protein
VCFSVKFGLGLFLPMAVLLVACDTDSQRQAVPEERVQARAEARWQALLAGEYEQAYGFLAPGFRSRVTLDSYRGRFKGKTQWLEAQFKGVDCDQDVCEAKFAAKYRFLGVPPFPPVEGETEEAEKWVFTQDDWWHVPRR